MQQSALIIGINNAIADDLKYGDLALLRRHWE